MWAPFARLILDGAVASWASHDATQASVTYEGRVLEWDPIERSIPATAGLAQHSNTRIKVADTDRVVRDLMASYTFRRRTCKIYLAQGGQHPTEVGTPILSSEPVFTGEVFKMAFGENWVELYLRDTLYGWMDEEFPPLITPELFPTFPITEAIFAPILQGHLVAADGQGKVPLTHIGLIGSPPVDRWALACHDVFQVIAVYRKEPGDGVFTIVPQGSPPAWTVTTSTQTVYGLAVDFNFLDFTSVQVDGTEIAVDVDGIDFRGGWGPLSAVSSTSLSPPGPLRNPVDFFINMTYFFLVKAGRADISEIFDTTSIANLRDRCEPAGDNYTLCDGAILRPITARQFIGQFLTSFEFFCHQQQSTVNNPGTITMGILSDSMSGPSFLEATNIIRGTFREEVGDPSFNELLVKYGENYRLNAFETQQLIVNTLEQGQLGVIEGSPPALEPKSERDTVVLPYVTDAATAEISILRRMSFISYGSYRQFFDVPLPGLATVLEPGKSAYITHRMGIPIGGYDAHEVKILGVSLDLGQLKASVRTITPVPFTLGDDPDVMYSDSSPYVSGNPSRYFWILTAGGLLYRSERVTPTSGAFQVWEAMALPSGNWSRFTVSNNYGECVLFGSDAFIATKELPSSGDPDAGEDKAWIKYDVPVPLLGGGRCQPADVNFWSPSNPTSIISAALAVTPSTTMYGGHPDITNDIAPDSVYDDWETYSNTLPAGTWNRILTHNGFGAAAFRRNVLIVGNGATIRRWYDDYNDNSWVSVSCPSGNWVDVARSTGDDIVAVGLSTGANQIMRSLDGAQTWAAITPPTGWTARNPRIIFDPNMTVAADSTTGTYVIVGGTISGVDAIVMIPRTGTPSLLTPVVATLPSLPSGYTFTAVARNFTTTGILVVGKAPSVDPLILSNPETGTAGTSATYHDWEVRTLLQTPFA